MRALLFFGERTRPVVGVLVRDAARVVRVDAVVAGLEVAALTRFLGTAISEDAFSLSSLDISSLLRFLVRVVLVPFIYAGVGFADVVEVTAALVPAVLVACRELGRCVAAGMAELVLAVVVAGPTRVLRALAVAAGGARVWVVGATTTLDEETAELVPSSSSKMVRLRLAAGIRWMRRSSRD